MTQAITANDLWEFIQSHHRVIGKLPKLRECVEHFEDKKLNVMMCFMELTPDRAAWIRQAARDDAEAERKAKQRRAIA
jgi:hypothetical protein